MQRAVALNALHKLTFPYPSTKAKDVEESRSCLEFTRVEERPGVCMSVGGCVSVNSTCNDGGRPWAMKYGWESMSLPVGGGVLLV